MHTPLRTEITCEILQAKTPSLLIGFRWTELRLSTLISQSFLFSSNLFSLLDETLPTIWLTCFFIYVNIFGQELLWLGNCSVFDVICTLQPLPFIQQILTEHPDIWLGTRYEVFTGEPRETYREHSSFLSRFWTNGEDKREGRWRNKTCVFVSYLQSSSAKGSWSLKSDLALLCRHCLSHPSGVGKRVHISCARVWLW